MKIPETAAPTAHGLLRIVAGLMYWQHGAMKLFGWIGGNAVDSWLSWPRGVGGMIEFFGGVLIMLGLKTRPVAFLLSGQMAVVYWWRHFSRAPSFFPIQSRGEVPVLLCFIFLYIWLAGPGRFSLDGALAKRKGD